MKFLVNWIAILLIAAGVLLAWQYPRYEEIKAEKELKTMCIQQKGVIVYTGPAMDKLACQQDNAPVPVLVPQKVK